MDIGCRNYVLVDRVPVREPNTIRWAIAFERTASVAFTPLDDGTAVSTVFLGTDHNWGDGPPILFETIAFGVDFDDDRERTSTWAEAEAAHAAMVERVRAAGPSPSAEPDDADALTSRFTEIGRTLAEEDP